ncbi:MAG TPA: family 20 glycosylhydrolase [Acidimicrobiales bacterium]|nr:family 20 glycosylhydrolase [Acidimicrobiales bacterium]
MILLPEPRRADWSGRTVDVADGDPAEAVDPALPPQGYRLTIGDDGVRIDAADDAGAFYARATLAQLRAQGPLPEGVVEDWPDVSVRGVMLDVSRDKVPTVETVEALIDRLASWKINHVELYMEHTFAYADHEEVWRDASPFTPDEIHRLDAFCKARFVELTPNQNCLGHFERWLRHDRYRALAISPDGWTDARGRHRPPTTVEPTNPDARALMASLLRELLSSFSSRRVHVGLDEPWELPDERFGDYLDYARELRALPELDGRQALMWGDIVASHPGELASIPDGVTVCEWGYEDGHPFDERADLLAAAGRPFWLCPGTSSWNTLVGRWSNMTGNCLGAARAAVRTGAEGLLATDWGDNGHLQYLPVSDPGFAFSAAVAWCLETNADLALADALSVHAFGDPTGGVAAALQELGDAHRLVAPQVPNNSILAMHLYRPRFRMGEGVTAGLTVDDLASVDAAITSARARLHDARPTRDDGAQVVAELDTSARLLGLLVRDARARLRAGGTLAAVDAAERQSFADEISALTDEHRSHWLVRNRPGGLDDSARRLDDLQAAYLAP